MRVQTGDIVRFKLTINNESSILEKKVIKTGSHMVPTNIGPYHSVYKEDVEGVGSTQNISQRSVVGSKLLGMAKNENKQFSKEGKLFEILVEYIRREDIGEKRTSLDSMHKKWLAKNCMKCRKRNGCQYYSAAKSKVIMHKKISENTLDTLCKFREVR